jgi:hypothetical protein
MHEKLAEQKRERIRVLALYLSHLYDRAMSSEELGELIGKPTRLREKYDDIIDQLYQQIAYASKIACVEPDYTVICIPNGCRQQVAMCDSDCQSLPGGCTLVQKAV